MNSLYRMLGISKQAVYQFQKSQAVFDAKMECLLFEAEELRQEHPGCGVEKMYDTLMPDFMGRDRFIDVFMDLGYRVKKNKNYIRTTHPVHSEYKNLIEGTWVTGPNQVWQSGKLPQKTKRLKIEFVKKEAYEKFKIYRKSDCFNIEATGCRNECFEHLS